MRSEQDGDPGAGAGDMRDRDVEEDRSPRRLVGAADEDQRRRQQRHQLPAGEEGQRVARAQHLGEREHEHAGEAGDDAAARFGVEVARREAQRRRGDQAEHPEEERRQAVDAEARRERRSRTPSRTSFRRRAPRSPTTASSAAPAAWTASAARNVRRGGARRAAEAEQRHGGEQKRGRHSDSSACRIDCSVASRRLMIARPAASRSNTASSSTR